MSEDSDSDWTHCGGKEHLLETFRKWERKAQKENSDTIANIRKA